MEGGAQTGHPTSDQSDEGIDEGPDGDETVEMAAPVNTGDSSESAEPSAPEARSESAPSNDTDPDRP